MDLNGLPQNIADQLTTDIARLEAKAERLTIAAENDRIMSLLPTNANLPLAYNGVWLDRSEGGWSAFGVNTDNNEISNLFQIKRVHESKVTLTTAWPIFVRWVDNRPGMNADASVEISDEVPQIIQVIE